MKVTARPRILKYDELFSELKMIYYDVNGWILPSEKKEKKLTLNLINKALLTLMKREYEHENVERANQKISECLNRMTYFSDQNPQITWRINEIPKQEKIERFLKEILELTGEGKMLLRARNKSPKPILYEYLIQDALDVLTLSQVLMQLPTPCVEADHGDKNGINSKF